MFYLWHSVWNSVVGSHISIVAPQFEIRYNIRLEQSFGMLKNWALSIGRCDNGMHTVQYLFMVYDVLRQNSIKTGIEWFIHKWQWLLHKRGTTFDEIHMCTITRDTRTHSLVSHISDLPFASAHKYVSTFFF